MADLKENIQNQMNILNINSEDLNEDMFIITSFTCCLL